MDGWRAHYRAPWLIIDFRVTVCRRWNSMLSYSIRLAGWQAWKHGRGERERQRGLTSTFGPNVETRTDRAHPDRIGFVERRSRGTASLNYSFGISWDYQCDSWQRWLPKAGKGEGMRFRIGGGIRVYANLLWPLRATRPIPISPFESH